MYMTLASVYPSTVISWILICCNVLYCLLAWGSVAPWWKWLCWNNCHLKWCTLNVSLHSCPLPMKGISLVVMHVRWPYVMSRSPLVVLPLFLQAISQWQDEHWPLSFHWVSSLQCACRCQASWAMLLGRLCGPLPLGLPPCTPLIQPSCPHFIIMCWLWEWITLWGWCDHLIGSIVQGVESLLSQRGNLFCRHSHIKKNHRLRSTRPAKEPKPHLSENSLLSLFMCSENIWSYLLFNRVITSVIIIDLWLLFWCIWTCSHGLKILTCES